MNAELQKIMEMPDGVLTIDDPETIRAAWGKRVTTSRTRGMDIQSYPQVVTAAKALWVRWIKEMGSDHRTRVVIAKKTAQARIDAALGYVSRDHQVLTADPGTALTDAKVSDLLAEREGLREERRFDEADKIRDYLIAHGVTVVDAKVAK